MKEIRAARISSPSAEVASTGMWNFPSLKLKW